MVTILVGRGDVSVVVAGLGANWITKYHAEFVCDGVNDQEEINAAMDFVASKGGGTVKLFGGEKGNFNLSGTLNA